MLNRKSRQISTILKVASLCGIMVTMSVPLHAFETTQAKTPEVNAQKDESIEIITVTGLRSLSFFRKQHREAEDDFFDAINALALDQSFDVKCETKRNSFSHIRKRVCEPKYINDIKYELTQLALAGRAQKMKTFDGKVIHSNLYKLSSRGELSNKVKAKRKVHLAALRKAIENNPEVLTKLENLNKAIYSLEKKKVEVFGEQLASTSVEKAAGTEEFVKDKE